MSYQRFHTFGEDNTKHIKRRDTRVSCENRNDNWTNSTGEQHVFTTTTRLVRVSSGVDDVSFFVSFASTRTTVDDSFRKPGVRRTIPRIITDRNKLPTSRRCVEREWRKKERISKLPVLCGTSARFRRTPRGKLDGERLPGRRGTWV